MKGLAALALAAAAAATLAGGPARAQERHQGDVENGERLYVTGCSSCHGLEGVGTDQGPTLQGVGAAAADFYLSTGRMPLDQPRDQAERKQPAYDEEEIRDLVAYVASLGDVGGPPIPEADPAEGDLQDGNLLYTANCAGCHNVAGSGGALGHSEFVPPVTKSTPTQVAEAIRVGPGAMPVFSTDTLDDEQVSSILRYVEYLKDPDDRGGAPLGRVGPIPEGFVAWLVGLGSLLLAAYWIGTRD